MIGTAVTLDAGGVENLLLDSPCHRQVDRRHINPHRIGSDVVGGGGECGHTAAQTVNGTEFDGRYFGGNTGQNDVTLPIRHRSLDILTDEGELVAVLEACDCESVTVSPCIHSGNDRGDPRRPAFVSDDDIIAVEPAFVTSREQQPCA